MRGQENVPSSGRLVVAGNHDSMLDPFILAAAIPRPIRYLGKSELWKVPGLRWWLGTLEAIPVHRGGSDLAAIAAAIEALEADEVVGIFPEGGVGREGPWLRALPGWRSRRGHRSCRCGSSTPGRHSGATGSPSRRSLR